MGRAYVHAYVGVCVHVHVGVFVSAQTLAEARSHTNRSGSPGGPSHESLCTSRVWVWGDVCGLCGWVRLDWR